MTGSSPRFLARLGRYTPTPWKGRYSLSRLFFNFYLLAIGSFVVIGLVADFIISGALKGITDDYTQRFMHGTVVLIEDELFRQPRKDWQKSIKALDEKFSYKLAIVERASLRLPPKQANRLDAGELAIDSEGDIIYHRLRNTPQILVVGPISPDSNPENPRGIPLELRIQLLTWSLIALILAIAMWFWVRPIWRDLEALRQTARALGEGNFESRSPEAHSAPFELLAETLNGMAERIQRLIATQKELSSAISHELRTPIARMRFALEMSAETDDAGERERLAKMMEADLDELDGLIDSSLTYARFERDPPEPQLAPVAIGEWLKDEVDAVRILGRHLALSLDLSRLPAGLTVDLDRKSMPYAIKNLLRNAIKYARSQVAVSADCIDDYLLIHVDDDGIGIPEDERERVFTAFTRLDRSRDRATGGYGLGLAIARQVLELHGGTASAHESPLGGARFTLSWPCRQHGA